MTNIGKTLPKGDYSKLGIKPKTPAKDHSIEEIQDLCQNIKSGNELKSSTKLLHYIL